MLANDLHEPWCGSDPVGLCPPGCPCYCHLMCTATCTPDAIGTVVECELGHDDGPRVHHEGHSHGNRVTWMTGPYDEPRPATPFPRRTPSLLEERIAFERENEWRR